ncbi:hypothetical protein GJAV_G00034450 [Gymnothorax javanicus]|nr:hypothetical protein GJAV_G00034450 [Gymnothorax javanicus]
MVPKSSTETFCSQYIPRISLAENGWVNNETHILPNGWGNSLCQLRNIDSLLKFLDCQCGCYETSILNGPLSLRVTDLLSTQKENN